MKRTRVDNGDGRQQRVAVFDLDQEPMLFVTMLFVTPCVSMNDGKNSTSIDFGVTHTFRRADKLTSSEFTINKD